MQEEKQIENKFQQEQKEPSSFKPERPKDENRPEDSNVVKKLFLLFLILILLLIVGIGAYLFGKNQCKENDTQSTVSETSTTQDQDEDTTSDTEDSDEDSSNAAAADEDTSQKVPCTATAGFKVYSSDDLCFVYPEAWIATTVEDTQWAVMVHDGSEPIGNTGFGYGKVTATLSKKSFTNADTYAQVEIDAITIPGDTSTIGTKEALTIDSVSAYKAEFTLCCDGASRTGVYFLTPSAVAYDLSYNSELYAPAVPEETWDVLNGEKDNFDALVESIQFIK